MAGHLCGHSHAELFTPLQAILATPSLRLLILPSVHHHPPLHQLPCWFQLHWCMSHLTLSGLHETHTCFDCFPYHCQPLAHLYPDKRARQEILHGTLEYLAYALGVRADLQL